MSPSIITLTTDFGAAGGYVGSMKGVALGINPDAILVDISHEVPAQDIAHGAFVLGSVHRYFSPDTVHVGVVDPGVGTSRRALLLVTPTGVFVAPDNGLLTHVLADQAAQGGATPVADPQGAQFLEPLNAPVPDGCSAYTLTRPEFWHHPVSSTFHGRDVFAPVAAHLSLGVPPERFGEPIDDVVWLNLCPPTNRDGAVDGRVIFVDGFGNLVSNIRADRLPGTNIEVSVGGCVVKGLRETFAGEDGLLALIGSHGYLEIAERNGSAASRLSVGVGDKIRVTRRGSATRDIRI